MIPSFANSAGWNWIGPTLIARKAPFTWAPMPGQSRQQQQPDARRRDRVAVALQHVVVADQEDRDAEEREADHEPLGLLARQLGVDPVDQHQPDRRQAAAASGNMYGSAFGSRARMKRCASTHRPEEERAVGERGVGDVLGACGQHRREPGRHEQGHGQQPEQLARARRHQFPAPASSRPRSSARTRSTASLRLRHSWSSTRLRRAGGIARAGMPLAYSSSYRLIPSGSS